MKAELAALGAFAACVYAGKRVGDMYGHGTMGMVAGGIGGLFVASYVGERLSEQKVLSPAPDAVNTGDVETNRAIRLSEAKRRIAVAPKVRVVGRDTTVAPFLQAFVPSSGNEASTDDAVVRAR